jgi:uncharacterized protein (DUF58 family)
MTEHEAGETPSIFSIGLTLFFAGLILFFALVKRDFSLVVLSASVLIIMYGTRLWCRLGLLRLKTVFYLDRYRAFPEEELWIKGKIENRKPLPVWAGLDLPVPGGTAEDGGLHGETGILPYETVELKRSFAVRRRGVFPLGPARIFAGDLLGLNIRSRQVPSEKELVVFPRLRDLKYPDIPFQEYFGIHASKGLVEDPAWYAGTRDYSGNRPSKNIHWKASARLGKLQEKLFEPTSHRKVFFIFDIRGFLRAEDRDGFERGLELVASLADRLMETGASFGFAANARMIGGRSPVLPVGRGPEHLGRLLELAARTEFVENEEIEEIMEEIASAGMMGYVYCGRSFEVCAGMFSRMAPARRKRVILLFAVKPEDGTEEEAPSVGPAGLKSYYFGELIDDAP